MNFNPLSADLYANSAHMQQADLVLGHRAVFRRLELVGGILSQFLLQAVSLLTFCFDPWQQAGYGWIFLLWLLLVIVGAYKLLCIRSGWSCADSGGFSRKIFSSIKWGSIESGTKLVVSCCHLKDRSFIHTQQAPKQLFEMDQWI